MTADSSSELLMGSSARVEHDQAEVSFDAFVVARWSSLVATAYLVTADRGIAEDCVQEALAKVHRHWRRVESSGIPEAYARKAVLNSALSLKRRRRVREVPLEDSDRERGDRQAAGAAESRTTLDVDLMAALRALPPRMRAVVVLRVVEDRSEAETAQLLGCSIGTVKSTSSRGLARLRVALGGAAQTRGMDETKGEAR